MFLLMIIASFAEVISIGVVLPFLAVLTAPERVFNNALAQPLISALSITEPIQLLLPLTVAFAIGAMLSGIMRLILLWAQTRLGHAIGADLSASIYRRTLYQPYAVHVARNSSEVIAGITSKVNGIVYHIVLPTLTILSSLVMLISILLTLLAIEPTIAAIAFAGFGISYALVILATKKALLHNSQLVSREESQIIKALQEGLGGIRDVLLDGTQATYCNIYRNADLPLRRAQANIAIIGGSPRYGFETLGMVLIAALSYSLASRSDGIAGAIPFLGALALGAQRLLPILQQAYYGLSNMRGGQVSLGEALDLLEQAVPEDTDATFPTPIPFQYCISLDNLTFRYSHEAPWVLKGLYLNLPKGSCIGFIGTTGSGKSTLLDIIMGLLHPNSGSLKIDDVVITDQNRRAWQAHIAHVPQAIFLADTTLAENIAFGVPIDQIDLNRVRQAARKAQIADTIESWDKQYQTLVGERGVRLSGGQRQRVGIARALYKKANVIVFDEATSSLDTETECDVMESIGNLGDELTIIIVAHRLTTLKNCSHVIELADGKIKRCGTYKDIIKHIV